MIWSESPQGCGLVLLVFDPIFKTLVPEQCWAHNRSSIKDKWQSRLTRFMNSHCLDFLFRKIKTNPNREPKPQAVSIVSELIFVERQRLEIWDVLNTGAQVLSASALTQSDALSVV